MEHKIYLMFCSVPHHPVDLQFQHVNSDDVVVQFVAHLKKIVEALKTAQRQKEQSKKILLTASYTQG